MKVLAAWFRLKYPHVAIGALASSAPILNFEDIVSPYSFNNIITNDFKSQSENYYKVIKGSWQQIANTTQRPRGLELLQKSFKICKQIGRLAPNSLCLHYYDRLPNSFKLPKPNACFSSQGDFLMFYGTMGVYMCKNMPTH